MKVLLVDDYPLILEGLIRIFDWKENGFSVVLRAGNGKQALEALEKQPVDIIFTDIEMPVMDGLVLIKEVRNKYPHIKIAVLSAHDDFELVRTAFKLGAGDYLLKHEMDYETIKRICDNFKNKIEFEDNSDVTQNSNVTNSIEEKKALEKVTVEYNDSNFWLQDTKKINDVLWKNHSKHFTLFCQYVSALYSDSDLKISDIANSLGISAGYLGKLVYRETKYHFSDFLNSYRIERAKDFLTTTTLKIYEVSERSGYKNVEHFTRVFKKITGLSPTEYANLHSKPK